MFKFNNNIVPNKVHIGWHFSSNKYVCMDAYSALKSRHSREHVQCEKSSTDGWRCQEAKEDRQY